MIVPSSVRKHADGAVVRDIIVRIRRLAGAIELALDVLDDCVDRAVEPAGERG